MEVKMDEDDPESQYDYSKILMYAGISIGIYVGYRMLFGSETHFVFAHKHIQQNESEFPIYPSSQAPFYSTDPSLPIKIYQSQKGIASEKPITLFELIDRSVKNGPNEPFFCVERKNEKTGKYDNDDPTISLNTGELWQKWTRNEVKNIALQACNAYISLGLNQYESVCIMGFNHPIWLFAYLGAIYAGGLAVGIYTTNNIGTCEYIANHCKCRIVVIENNKILQKWTKICDDIKTLEVIVVWDEKPDSELVQELNTTVMSWDQFILLGNGNDKKMLINKGISRRKLITPGHCSTLVYTSGTTGAPKGVMLSHDNLTWNCNALMYSIKHIDWSDEHHLISYLPLSHVAALFVDLYGPLTLTGKYNGSGCVWFARPDALKGSLIHTLKHVRPTIFFGVPRVYEKIEENIRKVGKKGGMITKIIGNWAKNIGLQATKNCMITGDKKIPYGYNFANKLVFQQIRNKLGFDRLQFLASGAAPIKQSTLEYFGSLNMRIMDFYGMSETTAVSCFGRIYHHIIGSCGSEIEGTQIIIDHQTERGDKKGEGEICFRGRCVMMGYMNDNEKTLNAIDNKGFLHSGDIGKIDENGLLFITGRIKEIIVTTGGENIAPVPIEDYLKDQMGGAISNVVLIGDKKKYLTILVTLKCKQDLETMRFTNDLIDDALTISPNCKIVSDARHDPKWKEYIQNAIDTYNNDSKACVSNAQRIQYFTILDGDFSVPDGELTSTLKLKRPIVYKNYESAIDSMY